MAKKFYEELKLKMVALTEVDVITASYTDGENTTEEGAQEDPFSLFGAF